MPTPMNRHASDQGHVGLCPITKPISATAADAAASWRRPVRHRLRPPTIHLLGGRRAPRPLECGQRLPRSVTRWAIGTPRSTGRRLFEATLAGGPRAADAETTKSHRPRQARGFRGALPPSPVARRSPGRQPARCLPGCSRPTTPAIKTVYWRGVPVVQAARHVARDELDALSRSLGRFR
jgi:hypothetical protein